MACSDRRGGMRGLVAGRAGPRPRRAGLPTDGPCGTRTAGFRRRSRAVPRTRPAAVRGSVTRFGSNGDRVGCAAASSPGVADRSRRGQQGPGEGLAAGFAGRPPARAENRTADGVRALRGPCTTQPALPSRTGSGMLPPASRTLLRGSGRWRSDAVPLGVWGWEDDSRTELHRQLMHLSKPFPPHEDSLRRDTDGRSRNP